MPAGLKTFAPEEVDDVLGQVTILKTSATKDDERLCNMTGHRADRLGEEMMKARGHEGRCGLGSVGQ